MGIFNHSHKRSVWRIPAYPFILESFVITVKHGSGSIMLKISFTSSGSGGIPKVDGIINFSFAFKFKA